MTYPDGEVVHYDYNRGGMLKKVYGTVKGDFLPQYPSTPHDSLVPLNLHGLGGQASLNSLPPVGDPVPLHTTYTYSYIDSITYNEYELKSEVFYGNGTHTQYDYDDIQRLHTLQSQTRTGVDMQVVTYTYDSVSNITGIANTAGALLNGLGGTYHHYYEYDDLYRLAYSFGQWDNTVKNKHLKDTVRMTYHKNGRIASKQSYANLYSEGECGTDDTTQNRRRAYSYNMQQPNTLASVYDSVTRQSHLFYWDLSGNMLTHRIPEEGNIVGHTWTEDNRLQTVTDKKYFSYYQYDAGGDRTYKLPCNGTISNLSGQISYYWAPDHSTLYASPYLVVTPRGYTKHYYAESERITSQIGRGIFPMLATPVTDTATANRKVRRADSLVLALNPSITDATAQLSYLSTLTNRQNDTCEAYWYHPDHLGSSSWITDSAGNPVQHLHYLPWGEDYVNQRLNDFNGVRYTFSAKEKDSETGLSYFGSRYYSSDLSIWLSVDPMSDKYPSTSPYAYCRNNPIILVDDNGNKDRPFNPEKDQGQTILQNINTPFSYAFDSKGRKIGYSISNYFTCYNCHSYAWNNSLGSKYSKAVNYLGLALSGGGAPFGIDFIQNYAYVLPRWNNDPTNDILEQGARQMLNTENNQVGDRVIYYYDENGSEKYEPGEPIVHSAIVEEVDVNGYTTLVKAKCGEGPITVNHPDAPNYYSTYKDPAGESHKTRRAYFRIPATNNQQEP